MKYVFALALALTLSQPAFASVQKLTSVNQLEADAKNFSLMFGSDQECSLHIQKHPEGIRVAMHSKKDGFAWLDVKYDSAVLLNEEFAEDGSYTKNYTIPNQGTLTAVHADDSYFHASMEVAGKKISCEMDF